MNTLNFTWPQVNTLSPLTPKLNSFHLCEWHHHLPVSQLRNLGVILTSFFSTPTNSQLPHLAASNFKTSFDFVSSKLYATDLK